MTSVATPAGAVIFDLDGTLVDSNYLHTLRGPAPCGPQVSGRR